MLHGQYVLSISIYNQYEHQDIYNWWFAPGNYHSQKYQDWDSLLSRNFDDRLSSNFHRFVILCICWDAPTVKASLWQWPIVSTAFKAKEAKRPISRVPNLIFSKGLNEIMCNYKLNHSSIYTREITVWILFVNS